MNLEDTLIEINQTKTDSVWYHLDVQSKSKNWTHRKRKQKGGCQELESGGNGERLVKGYEISAMKWIRSENPVYNMVIIVDNTVLYNWNFLKE